MLQLDSGRPAARPHGAFDGGPADPRRARRSAAYRRTRREARALK